MKITNIFKEITRMLRPSHFDGVARLFNLFLENKNLPRDSVYDRIVAIRDKLVIRDHALSENDRYMLPIIGLMVVMTAQAIIEDEADDVKKKALISDLLECEDFLKLSSFDDTDSDTEMQMTF